jgi:hypothetical protein
MRIEDWTVVGNQNQNPYQAPEERRWQVRGEVYGNPSFPDGHGIRTSDVVMVTGNVITTRSGSVYELGEPNEEYAMWCWENGHHVPTPEEPIKLC